MCRWCDDVDDNVMVMIVLARQQHQLKLRLVDDHLVMLVNIGGDDNVDDEEQMMLAGIICKDLG